MHRNKIFVHQVSFLNGFRDKNKPGTVQVGVIPKGQEKKKNFKMSKYSLQQYPKNTEVGPNWRARGDALRFFNVHSVAKLQKNQEETLCEAFSKKSQCQKKLKRGPFSLARYCMLRGKKEKHF